VWLLAVVKLISDDWYAETGVNEWATMQPRMQSCWEQLAARWGVDSFPNIVMVNYYEQGDPLAVVDWLNTQRALGLPPAGAVFDMPQPPPVPPTMPFPPPSAPQPPPVPPTMPFPPPPPVGVPESGSDLLRARKAAPFTSVATAVSVAAVVGLLQEAVEYLL
jgi:hypothetical protein